MGNDVQWRQREKESLFLLEPDNQRGLALCADTVLWLIHPGHVRDKKSTTPWETLPLQSCLLQIWLPHSGWEQSGWWMPTEVSSGPAGGPGDTWGSFWKMPMDVGKHPRMNFLAYLDHNTQDLFPNTWKKPLDKIVLGCLSWLRWWGRGQRRCHTFYLPHRAPWTDIWNVQPQRVRKCTTTGKQRDRKCTAVKKCPFLK